jgi:hypothetical protein
MRACRVDWLHFYISLVVLIGGGILIFVSPTQANAAWIGIGSCIGFWFGKPKGNPEERG